VGEALVSVLEAKGTPSVVQRTLVRPPVSRIGAITPQERTAILQRSPLAGRYDKTIDRESAHEMLKARAARAAAEAEQYEEKQPQRSDDFEPVMRPPRQGTRTTAGGGRQRQSVGEALAKSVARSVGSQLGRQIVRGILGAIFKGR
jgi:DNA helicase HerA-like ATPase